MVTITIIASEPPCDKCMTSKKIAQNLVERYPGQVELKVLNALEPEAAKYGVIMTPTVLVDRALVAIGKIPNESRLEEIVKKKLGL